MIYLDNAATSFPKPIQVSRAMNDCINNYCGNPGRSGHKMSMKTGLKIYEARKNITDLIGGDDPTRLIFTSNTTEALNIVIKGVLSSGDHVIVTSMEHNSVLRPIHNFKNITYDVAFCNEEGTLDIKEVEKLIKHNTKLIISTFCSNITGSFMPVKQIGKLCKNRNILFLVDAAQGAGSEEINFLDLAVDAMCFAGHKGFLGPQGTGFIYVKDNLLLKLYKEGGTGSDSLNLENPVSFPEAYEAGTLNSPGIIGLNEGVKFVKLAGVKEIGKYEKYLADFLYSEIKNMGNGIKIYGPSDLKKRSSIILFNMEGFESEEICDILSSNYNIAARGGYHCAPLAHKTIGTDLNGAVRLSIGPFNTKEEIRATISAIYKIKKMKR